MYKIEQLSNSELREVFLKFLEENNAKELFIKNCPDPTLPKYDSTKRVDAYNLLRDAFCWNRCEFGTHSFWRDLNDKFIATFWNMDEKVS